MSDPASVWQTFPSEILSKISSCSIRISPFPVWLTLRSSRLKELLPFDHLVIKKCVNDLISHDKFVFQNEVSVHYRDRKRCYYCRFSFILRTNLFLLSEDTMIKNLEILKISKIFLLLLLIKGSLLSEDKRIYWAGLIVASDGLDNWSACENQTETFKTFN